MSDNSLKLYIYTCFFISFEIQRRIYKAIEIQGPFKMNNKSKTLSIQY